MRQHRYLVPLSLVILASLLAPGSSHAQSGYRYSIGLMAGFGSAFGSEPASTTVNETFVFEDQFDFGFQLNFNMEVDRGTLFGVRLGQFDVELANNGLLAQPVESELTYVTLAGEYRIPASFYQSGFFAGLGYYAIDGQGIFEDDTALGVSVGTTGDFKITDRLSLMVEITANYADLDYAQFFVIGNAGLAFHF
ncbi:MAG: hypothetical protein AAF560_03815 [Acidobacteriota bacterium]